MSGRIAIEVVADWAGLGGARLVGELTANRARGKEVFAFEYDGDWLAAGQAATLDPAQQLYGGPQCPPVGHEQFGVFLDSAPDRWGRLLMRRREALRARREGRVGRALVESDYLLGVHDAHRLGGLRYRVDGRFRDVDDELVSPPWASLRELQHASLQLERDDAEEDADYARWLRMLVSPAARWAVRDPSRPSIGPQPGARATRGPASRAAMGSTVGASRPASAANGPTASRILAPRDDSRALRPKASVRDERDRLWIAKFPSRNDRDDVGGWEMVVHDLARAAGLVVPEARMEKFAGKGSQARGHRTFLTRRFDRTDARERIHFVSALTMLGRLDGADGHAGASYLHLAEVLAQVGSRPAEDLEQLWRRIVFFVCVSNTDDHLRNHGFLLESSGFRLAPAYDVNPDHDGEGLTLDISESDNAQDLELVLQVANLFRLRDAKARAIVDEVVAAVRTWRRVADARGLGRAPQQRMARAFRIADA